MAKQQKKKIEKYSDISSTRPMLCPNGKYRWMYDVPMLKNPSILLEVFRVLGISFSAVWLFFLLLGGCESNFRLVKLWDITRGFLILTAVFMVLGCVANYFVSWYYNFKYCILFIMDENEVVHKQLPSTLGKARAIGKLTAMAGVALGRNGMVGTGILAANRTSLSCSYSSVLRIIPSRRKNLIKVWERFYRNMFFVPDEDFDFDYQYLFDHCPNAKKG
ncbi:MAG: hypothetical protein J6T52_01500 [Bacteroidaceae bacterium]|nr:hypothetical protein [Bacteroidaceae bacterium]